MTAAELRAQFNRLNDLIAQRATPADIANAVAGTSANTIAVALLGITVSDLPTQSEVQTIASKLDELIAAARR